MVGLLYGVACALISGLLLFGLYRLEGSGLPFVRHRVLFAACGLAVGGVTFLIARQKTGLEQLLLLGTVSVLLLNAYTDCDIGEIYVLLTSGVWVIGIVLLLCRGNERVWLLPLFLVLLGIVGLRQAGVIERGDLLMYGMSESCLVYCGCTLRGLLLLPTASLAIGMAAARLRGKRSIAMAPFILGTTVWVLCVETSFY